ncbi:disulfide bond formation protein B [Aurantiacibacter gangjinensis]|uniref:Disulfide bond formation protein n=1 Tax=Aurantiacibacter gangjinensis TaxID=502682 RepID=A0A0G9MLR1_9SPHN|nr:disulfide bond formation protein B [Aurantiacibacter gangjinensis]APE27559.1 Periplasmic thiol:disulfide oxidoreductase DsbB, required for DsbA reoxidation [Aurantiacibacter gangjinensis]KLE31604.1 disulfide bond formation protein [Aurantiacibacter gangjinensis]
MTTPLPRSDKLAQRLALAIPALLLAGAYVSEYGFGLFPCEMCWWQRYPHFAAIGLALISTFAAQKRMWIGLAALAIAISGAIGAFHAGVEYGWWPSPLGCTGSNPFSLEFVRCDEAAWSLFGISLAGWNALLSIGSAVAIWVLLLAKERA